MEILGPMTLRCMQLSKTSEQPSMMYTRQWTAKMPHPDHIDCLHLPRTQYSKVICSSSRSSRYGAATSQASRHTMS